MTVETTTSSVSYPAPGTTLVFPFNFLVYEEAELFVTLYDTIQLIDLSVLNQSQYSIVGLGEGGGGSVNLVTAITPTTPNPTGLRIDRIVPLIQPLELSNEAGFFPDTLMTQLDEMVMQTQQVSDLAFRALVVPVGETPLPLNLAGMIDGQVLGQIGGKIVPVANSAADAQVFAVESQASAAQALISQNSAASSAVVATNQASLASAQVPLAGAQAALATTQAAAAAISANLALTAGSAGNPYVNAAATYVPQGVAAYSLTSGGTGGTNGTNILATFSGGTLTTNPTIRFDIVGGIVVNVRLVSPGLYIGTGTPAMPAVTFPGAAGSPAITLTAGVIVPLGGNYWAASADSQSILYWSNTAGSPAQVLNPNGSQIALPNLSSATAALAALYGVKLIYGRGQKTPNLFVLAYGNVGKFVQSNGSLGTNASFAATDDLPVAAGNSYVFSRRPEQLAFKDATGTFLAGSYSAPTTGGVFFGSINGNQLTITSVTAGTLAVGTPIDVIAAGTPGGVAIQSLGTGSGGTGTYTLNQTFPLPLSGLLIYGGYTVTAPANAATMQASLTNTQPTFGYAVWGIYPGTALPALRNAGSYLDAITAARTGITNARAVVRSLSPQGQQLFNLSDPTTATGFYWANGALLANSAFFATHLIPVDPGGTYTSDHSSQANQGQYFDEYGAFGGYFTITANSPFTIPSGVFFIAFSGSASGFLSLKFVAGSSVPAGTLNFLSPTTLDARVATLEGSSLTPRISTQIINLFDKDAAFYGYAISSAGVRYQSLPSTANYVASANIPVTAGSPIWVGNLCAYPATSGGIQRIAFLNAAGALVGSWTGNVPDGTFTPPATATQMIMDVPNPRWAESLMVINGSSPPPGYRPYKLTSDKPKQNAQIILLGDSFTDVVATAGGWVPYFVRTTGSFIVANNALAGRATRDALKDPSGNALTAASFVAATDVIIELGTNDYGGGRTLGTIADASSSYSGGGSFYNDVYTVLNTLYGWASSTTATMLRVAWVTPTIRGVVTSISGQPVYPAANSAGAYLTDYIAAIKAVCTLFGTPVIDMFSQSGVNLVNLGTMTIDGLHPSDPIGRQNYGRTEGRLWNAL